MDLEKETQEYQDIKDWLHGKKPSAKGRTWRRVAAAVVPRVIREPLEKHCGAHVGPIVGVLLVGLGPLAVGTCFIASAFVMLDITQASLTMGASTLAVPGMEGWLPVIRETKAVMATVALLGVTLAGLGVLFRRDL